jgi:hypothetical protein
MLSHGNKNWTGALSLTREGLVRKMVLLVLFLSTTALAQSWRECTPNSIGPGGCDSIGPGGGKSIGPGGGQSIGPGGGLSIGPGGGQSIGPGGGQSIGPDGGKSLTRDRSKGLNTDTMRPYDDAGYNSDFGFDSDD